MEENGKPTAVAVTKSPELLEREQTARMQFELSPVGQMFKQFEVQQRMAQMFAKSLIVPKAYQNNVADCTIAIDMAARMKCNPLTVMQNLVIVQGRPTWQAQFLIACINQCGRFTNLQYKQWQDGEVGELEYEDNEWDANARRNVLVKKKFNGKGIPNYCCQAYATELATGEVMEGTAISVKMAVVERWFTKSGSKWQTMPRQMLIYRAAAFFQRAYCPEIGMGFHTTEEIQDAVVVSDTPTTTQARRSTLTDIAASAAMAANTPTNEPSAPMDTDTAAQTTADTKSSTSKRTLL